MNFFKKKEYEKEFDALLGRFVRNFSELESYILYMWGVIEYPKAPDKIFSEKAGTLLEARRKAVTAYIHKNLPNLQTRWDRINNKIGQLNDKRRLLVHATGHADFFEDAAHFRMPHLNDLHKIEHKDLKGLLNDLAEIFTGDDGINGIFVIDFRKERYNEYNRTVEVGKIIYKVNNEIITDFKG